MTTLTPSAVEPAAPTRSSQRRLTVGLCLNIVAIAFESIAVATALPVAARDLDGLRYYAWSFSLFLIAMLFSTVLAGRISDRVGPAKPLIAGLLFFLVGLGLAGTATEMLQLVGGRLVQGLGSGLINTAIFVSVARAYPAEQRPRIFTFISTAWVLPAFVGPPVAAWLTGHLSWHWVFFAVMPLVVGGGLMVLPSLRALTGPSDASEHDQLPTGPTPEPPVEPARVDPAPVEPAPILAPIEPEAARPAPIWAAAVVALAAAALQLAGQRLDWSSLGLVVVGLAGLVGALPKLMPGCFTSFGRGLPAVIIVRGVLAGAFVGGEAFVPLMLVEEKGIALVLAGAALTVGSVGWMAGSWLQSQPWLGLRRDRIISLGCLSVAIGLGIVGLVAWMPALPYGLVAVGWVFSGLGMGLATSSTSLAVMSLSQESQQGRNAASLNLSDALGAGIFVGVSGTLFAALRPGGDLPLTFGSLLVVMSLVALLAVAASLRIGPLANESARGQ